MYADSAHETFYVCGNGKHSGPVSDRPMSLSAKNLNEPWKTFACRLAQAQHGVRPSLPRRWIMNKSISKTLIALLVAAGVSSVAMAQSAAPTVAGDNGTHIVPNGQVQ